MLQKPRRGLIFIESITIFYRHSVGVQYLFDPLRRSLFARRLYFYKYIAPPEQRKLTDQERSEIESNRLSQWDALGIGEENYKSVIRAHTKSKLLSHSILLLLGTVLVMFS